MSHATHVFIKVCSTSKLLTTCHVLRQLQHALPSSWLCWLPAAVELLPSKPSACNSTNTHCWPRPAGNVRARLHSTAIHHVGHSRSKHQVDYLHQAAQKAAGKCNRLHDCMARLARILPCKFRMLHAISCTAASGAPTPVVSSVSPGPLTCWVCLQAVVPNMP